MAANKSDLLTVGKLRKRIENLPDDAIIMIEDTGCDCHYTTREIESMYPDLSWDEIVSLGPEDNMLIIIQY